MSEAGKKLLAEVQRLPREEQLALVDFINASFGWEKEPEPCQLKRLIALRIEEIRQGDIGPSQALTELYAN